LLTREQLHQETAGEAFRQLFEASPAPSLPLSYLVEIVSQRDAELLNDLQKLVEAKRRQLHNSRSAKNNDDGEGKL
jgi:hypothetical protein